MTQKEEKEKRKTGREELGKFFYDLAKTTFAVMVVLGNVVAMATAEEMGIAAIGVLVFGVYLTFCLAYIGNRILKD